MECYVKEKTGVPKDHIGIYEEKMFGRGSMKVHAAQLLFIPHLKNYSAHT